MQPGAIATLGSGPAGPNRRVSREGFLLTSTTIHAAYWSDRVSCEQAPYLRPRHARHLLDSAQPLGACVKGGERAATGKAKRRGEPEKMLACAHCGVHVPESEGVRRARFLLLRGAPSPAPLAALSPEFVLQPTPDTSFDAARWAAMRYFNLFRLIIAAAFLTAGRMLELGQQAPTLFIAVAGATCWRCSCSAFRTPDAAWAWPGWLPCKCWSM